MLNTSKQIGQLFDVKNIEKGEKELTLTLEYKISKGNFSEEMANDLINYLAKGFNYKFSINSEGDFTFSRTP